MDKILVIYSNITEPARFCSFQTSFIRIIWNFMIFIQIKAVNPPSLIVLGLQPQDLDNWSVVESTMSSAVFQSILESGMRPSV